MDSHDLAEHSINVVPPKTAHQFNKRYMESSYGKALNEAMAAPPRPASWKPSEVGQR